jgi:glycosyltransferase involved in cell wall biosynthesis
VPPLLFISNLFPDTREPYRGLDNATVLHHLAREFEIRVVALRPKLPLRPARRFECRPEDRVFAPKYLEVPYIPKIGSRWNHRLMARTLREALDETTPSLVLSSWIYPDSCAVSLLSAELGFPFVSIAQGSDVHQYLKMPVRRSIIVEALGRASAVITRSGELARLLAEAGVAREKAHPVYNGIDFEVFKPGDPAAARRSLGLPVEGKMALFVGNFFDIKNPLLLVEAFAGLADKSAFLVTIGGGPLEAEAKALAAKLAAKVIFAGRKLAPEVAEYMRAADLLCLPSKNEGVPNVILEAFASGLPVLASRVGGIPEVHNREFLGKLVAPGDAGALREAMAELLSQPPRREQIREHGLQFSWERAASAYARLLTAAANSPGAAR